MAGSCHWFALRSSLSDDARMKPDTTMLELWQSKDTRSHRFGGDVRALCRHLMEKQETPHATMPLVRDFTASQAAHRARIAELPPPVAGEVLLPDDPIIAELREIRAALGQERAAGLSMLREEPPEYGEKKD